MLKNIHFLGILLLSSFFLVSCETEPLEGEFETSDTNNPSDPNNPSNPNNPDGTYFPMAVGNSWSFVSNQSEENNIQTAEGPMEFDGTMEFEGNTYFSMPALVQTDTGDFGDFGDMFPEGMELNVTSNHMGGYRKNGNDYIQVSETTMSSSMAGMEISMTSTIQPNVILKDNLSEGETWDEQIEIIALTDVGMGNPQSQSMTLNRTYTILAQNVTATVNNQEFQNVIKVGSEDEALSAETWYAKNVGPIYMRAEDPDGWVEMLIESYTIN